MPNMSQPYIYLPKPNLHLLYRRSHLSQRLIDHRPLQLHKKYQPWSKVFPHPNNTTSTHQSEPVFVKSDITHDVNDSRPTKKNKLVTKFIFFPTQ
ncbi:hypothetical protein LXL04_034134 [Taraxacum kok-saghyz]